jgi:hypothetical protein
MLVEESDIPEARGKTAGPALIQKNGHHFTVTTATG